MCWPRPRSWRINGLDCANQLAIDRPQTAVLYISAFSGSVALERDF